MSWDKFLLDSYMSKLLPISAFTQPNKENWYGCIMMGETGPLGRAALLDPLPRNQNMIKTVKFKCFFIIKEYDSQKCRKKRAKVGVA